MSKGNSSLQHNKLISQMTLEDKASLMSGASFWKTKAIERLGIPSMMLADGPHGLRKESGKAAHLGLTKSIPATCFPTAGTLANSWDIRLLRDVGEALGREAAAENVGVLLGPGLNITRDPLGGRNFEYYSEDPYISGELAAAMVEGLQSTGISASPKHFAVNSQEHLRMSIDEIVDERTMRELYLEGFRRVVMKARPKVIMSSYNKVNGTYTNENPHLLDDILKKEWGFDGVIVTDWGGNNDRVAALKAGNQLEMPTTGSVTDTEIVSAVRAGELDEQLLDMRVDDLLELVYATQNSLKTAPAVNHDEHHQLAIDAARRSIVLLKNDDDVLPLCGTERFAVIGDFAKSPRYQGAGSSLVNPTKLDTSLEALAAAGVQTIGFEPGFKRAGGRSTRRHNKARQLAEKADTVLLFLGLPEASEAEGIDREHMRLPDNQLKLVDDIVSLGKKIIIVLASGAPVELPFIDKVQAIVHGFLGGQGGATALVDVLTGRYNPSGKLAMSYPLHYEDTPTAGNYPGKERTAEHREGLFVGYRYYDTRDIPVRYPFGYGLSYTNFEYSDLMVNEQRATFRITNTGSIGGEEIAQLYVSAPRASYYAPRHELKGFAKVVLAPGESKVMTIDFDDHTFAHFDTEHYRWATETNEYVVEVGASSRGIRLKSMLLVYGDQTKVQQNDLPSYVSGDIKNVSREEFARLLGRKPPSEYWNRQAPLTMNDTIRQLHYQNWFGKLCYAAMMNIRKFFLAIGRLIQANNIMFIVDMPFNKIERMSGGKISHKIVKRFVRWTSRHK